MEQYINYFSEHEKHVVTLKDKTITIVWFGRDNQLRPYTTDIHSQGYETDDLANRAFKYVNTRAGLQLKLEMIGRKARRELAAQGL
jgi:hypothetical protein